MHTRTYTLMIHAHVHEKLGTHALYYNAFMNLLTCTYVGTAHIFKIIFVTVHTDECTGKADHIYKHHYIN